MRMVESYLSSVCIRMYSKMCVRDVGKGHRKDHKETLSGNMTRGEKSGNTTRGENYDVHQQWGNMHMSTWCPV